MTSERIQRRVERLLDQIDAAEAAEDWNLVSTLARDILDIDEGNREASAYLSAAERRTGTVSSAANKGTDQAVAEVSPEADPRSEPTSFANGRYEVRRFLGEGGKKKVYLAHDAQLDRDVAFALIKTEGLDEAARMRVTREAQAMGRLGSHPHIVTVYDIGEENGQPYLVLPVLPGGDVEGVIEDAPDHKLSIEQAVKIATETCLGLEFSHAKGIIHRDLKPGNVWLAEDGRAMIGDFGLAVAVDRSRLTQAGMMVGTVNYMPPEQAMGGEVTPQSDLYSLGAMLYEMVCGRPPFVGDESVAIIGQHLNTPPVAPSWHRPDCPPGLEALILRLLEKDATKRPAAPPRCERRCDHRSARLELPPSRRSRCQRRTSHRPSVPPHLRRPRERDAPAPPGLRRRRVRPGRAGHGRRRARHRQDGICASSSRPTCNCAAAGRSSATATRRARSRLPYLAVRRGHAHLRPRPRPGGLRSELGTGAGEVARIVSEVRDKVHVELRDAWRPGGRPLAPAQRGHGLPAQRRAGAAAGRRAGGPALGRPRHARPAAARRAQPRGRPPAHRRHLPRRGGRPHASRSPPRWRTCGGLNSFLRVPLRGLTVDEVHRMYEAIRGNEVPWAQAEAVHRQTEGNPLFVQEVLRYLVEEGLVVREDGRYVPQVVPGDRHPRRTARRRRQAPVTPEPRRRTRCSRSPP